MGNIFNNKLPILKIVNREKFIIDFCNSKNILHIGAIDRQDISCCGLHLKIKKVCNNICGIDIDRIGMELAKQKGINDIILLNAINISQLKCNFKIDIIVAGEIIEHLPNPGLFLRNLRRYINSDMQIIITTPNAYNIFRLLLILIGYERIHNEHIQLYSYSTLKHLIETMNLEIAQTYYYNIHDTLLSRLLYRIFPYLSSGLIFIIKKKG